ncbi:DUF6463 family protein [Sphingorhabdus sp.]|jgi:hypothetical protein|uniref:DUF6463 family protein n=1 Tax=Sphingorhabdus sp. TaxID=1902408 RepID=UPI0037CA2C90
MRRRWIGRWIIGVAILHTLFGLVAFGWALKAMAVDGFWNTVGSDPMRGAVAWFLLFGFMMAVCGWAIDALERTRGSSFGWTGWALLVVTAIVIILMPVSGAWLLVPPAIAMIRNAKAIS